MRKLSSLITGAALILTAGALGCVDIDPGDPFESLTTTLGNNDTTGDGDGDPAGDGDGAPGDGDGSPGDGDGAPGDGDGAPACGSLGEACSGDTCCDGLSCQADGTCGLGGGDGDGAPGDGDGAPGDDPWDPATCMDPAIPVMVGMLPGSFCSAPCMADLDCPPGPPGSQSGCFLIADGGMEPTNCGLVCQVAMPACPAGAECQDLMDPGNPGLGLCTYQ